MVNLEVADTYCADATVFVELLEGAPCVDVFAFDGPVNQIEVEIVELHFAQGFVECGECFFVAEIGVPDFGCDEKVAAWDAGFADALAGACFVAVDGCGVDAAIAESDGFFDGGHEFCAFFYFKYAESKDGHVDSIC